MSTPKLHASGLHPESPSAKVLDFMMSNQLGLLGLAAAAGVVAAECRYNDWVFNHVKKSDLSREQWLAFLDSGEAVVSRCMAAMADFKSHRSVEALCSEFSIVAARFNERSLPSSS
jgi:hypothetical protein